MDNLTGKLDEELIEGLDLQHDSCYFCNGFYGPNFGEPICGTCHDFLYSEDFELIDALHRPLPNPVHASSAIPIEKDDGDSGNDEPSEETGPIPLRPVRPGPNLWGVEADNIPEEEDNVELNQDRAVPSRAAVEVSVRVRNPAQNLSTPEFNAGGDKDFAVKHDHEGPAPAVAGRSVLTPSQQPEKPEINEKMARRLALLTTPASIPVVLITEDISLKLPPEIWGVVFNRLDPTSVLMVSKVCTQWKTIVNHQFADTFWEEYTRTRWPLTRPIYNVESWHSVCSDMIDSLPCKPCFLDMNSLPNIDTNERSLRQARLTKEIKSLKIDLSEGIEATPLDDSNYNWLARINGPPESPYQGGVFYLNLKIHSDYPLKPPVVRFLTKIFHPNVSRHGDIGIDTINHNWTLAMTISKILLSIQSLLTDPCTEPNMEANAATLYQHDKRQFDKVARVWTWKYAMHDVLLH